MGGNVIAIEGSSLLLEHEAQPSLQSSLRKLNWVLVTVRTSQDLNFSIFYRVVKKLELSQCRREADFRVFFVIYRSFLYVKSHFVFCNILQHFGSSLHSESSNFLTTL